MADESRDDNGQSEEVEEHRSRYKSREDERITAGGHTITSYEVCERCGRRYPSGGSCLKCG